jgi:ubiquinone/menaquinone biosynthesis C-methylase UbiE
VLVRKLASLKSCLILDAATGVGGMTKILSDNLNASIISVDLDREVFQDVNKTFEKKRVDFVLCDLASLPFNGQVFCCIVCDVTLSAVDYQKQYLALKEFKRVLKTESKLYITDYGPEEPPKSKRDELAVEAWRIYKAVSEFKGTPHYQELPPSLIGQWLEDLGFHDVKHEMLVVREKLEWGKGFEEYYGNMKEEIAEIKDSRIKEAFQQKLEQLKKEIESNGATSWSGINLIQASST